MIVLDSIRKRFRWGRPKLFAEIEKGDLDRFSHPSDEAFLQRVLDFKIREEELPSDLPQPCLVLPITTGWWGGSLRISGPQKGDWILGLVCQTESERLTFRDNDFRRGFRTFNAIACVQVTELFDGRGELYSPKGNIEKVLVEKLRWPLGRLFREEEHATDILIRGAEQRLKHFEDMASAVSGTPTLAPGTVAAEA